MSNPLCDCTPDPPAKWVKGVCVKCWAWSYNPKHRAAMDRMAAGKPVVVPVKKSMPCVHVGDPLTIAEKKANGLELGRTWHRCQIGLTANKKGVPGVACSCEGCSSKCEGYVST